jgi:hypothetical protein
MGFIRIFEDQESRSGWRSVWDPGKPRSEGWEAVPKGGASLFVVSLDGIPQGRVVARGPGGRPIHNRTLQEEPGRPPYQGELGVAPDRVVAVGFHSLAPFGPAEAVAQSYVTGNPVPTERLWVKATRR